MKKHTAFKQPLFILLTLCTVVGTTLPAPADDVYLQGKEGAIHSISKEAAQYSSVFTKMLTSEFKEKEEESGTKENPLKFETLEEADIALNCKYLTELEEIWNEGEDYTGNSRYGRTIHELREHFEDEIEKEIITKRQLMQLIKTADFFQIRLIYDAACIAASRLISWENNIEEWRELNDGSSGVISRFINRNKKVFFPLLLNPDTKYTPNQNTRFEGGQINPEGTTYLEASQNEIHIKSLETNEVIKTIATELYNSICGYQFSHNGKLIAAIGSNYKTKVWNAETGEPLYSFSHAIGTPKKIAFSPDSTQLAIIGDIVFIRNLSNGKLVHTIKESEAFPSSIKAACFSPDNTKLLTAIDVPPTVIVWDLKTKERILDIDTGNTPIKSVKWNSDREEIMTAHPDEIIIWNSKTGERITPPLSFKFGLSDSPDTVQVGLSPDNTKLLTETLDEITRENKSWVKWETCIRIYDFKTGTELLCIKGLRDKRLAFIQWSLDSKKIVLYAPEATVNKGRPFMIDLSEEWLAKYIDKDIELERAALLVFLDKLATILEEERNSIAFLEKIAHQKLLKRIPEDLDDIIASLPKWLREHLQNKYSF